MKGIIYGALAGLIIWASVSAFAQTASRVDGNSLKITTEKTYTYEELQNRITVLTSERDRAQSNADNLTAQIAELEGMVKNTGITAVKAKAVEAVEESDKLEQGE